MKKIFLAAFFIFLSENVFAQIDETQSRQHVILKFLPLGLFDVDNTFQVGVEIPFPNKRFTFQQEAGYGHSSFNAWYHDGRERPDKQTFKIRSQLRFYFYEKKWGRSYVAGEYLFKRVEHHETQWVGQDCSNGSCGYFENKNVRFGKFSNAGHVKFGWQFYFSNRMTLDVYTGLGLRKVRYSTLTPGVGRAQPQDSWVWWSSNWSDQSELMPSVAMGFQIGFALGKFKPKQ